MLLLEADMLVSVQRFVKILVVALASLLFPQQTGQMIPSALLTVVDSPWNPIALAVLAPSQGYSGITP